MPDRYDRQRRWARVDIDLPVLVRRPGDETLGRFGRLSNLSVGGGQVVLDRPLTAGGILKLRLTLGGRILETTAKVAYAFSKGGQEYRAGVEFLDLSPSDWSFIQQAVAEERAERIRKGGPPEESPVP